MDNQNNPDFDQNAARDAGYAAGRVGKSPSILSPHTTLN